MPVSPEEVLRRFRSDEGIIVAEGYLFEFQQRGYLKAGCFVPEVVLEHPELVRQLHREFVHAGSEVVLAFTYYAHREKMRLIGRENDLEKINKLALKIAREVADETNTLMAGNLSNTTIYKPNDPENDKILIGIFKEQVEWAVEGKADYLVIETFDSYGEAKLALETALKYGQGLPVVATLSPNTHIAGEDVSESCRKLEEGGAAVVGLNCAGGLSTMLPLVKKIREKCKGPVAALPVPYRTTPEAPVFMALRDIDDQERSAFAEDLDAYLATVTQVREFTREAWDAGIRYLGLCCGNRAHYQRAMAEEVGRKPPASRYTADMTQHYSRLKDERHTYGQKCFEAKYKTN